MSGIKITEPPAGQARRITSATTTNITTTRTIVQRIIVATTAAGTITVQDAAGNVKLVLPTSVAVGVYECGFVVQGLTVITGASSDITVVYV